MYDPSEPRERSVASIQSKETPPIPLNLRLREKTHSSFGRAWLCKSKVAHEGKEYRVGTYGWGIGLSGVCRRKGLEERCDREGVVSHVLSMWQFTACQDMR